MTNSFIHRHIGPTETEIADMLKTVGADSLDQLIDQTIPEPIRTDTPLDLPDGLSETDYISKLKSTLAQNHIFKSYIGLGYHPTRTPSVIQRNIFENPGWYTQYTPYQAEIAQGRLEALLNFQTMVSDLTDLELSNASLLDEATAAAEAMTLSHRVVNKRKTPSRNRFFVDKDIFPQTLEVVEGRALPLNIEVVVGKLEEAEFDETYFGVLVQNPDQYGRLRDLTPLVQEAHKQGLLVTVAADIMSLLLVKPPGEMGADIAVGSTQRFGVPMGFGGPHAAYFATHPEYKRDTPGRIIGASVDKFDHPAYRMALQTREQHIRREKATSNICTAQALLAIMAGMYAVYHGPDGLRKIASRIHHHTRELYAGLEQLNIHLSHDTFFDTLRLDIPDAQTRTRLRDLFKTNSINVRWIDDDQISIALNETTDATDIQELLDIVANALDKESPILPQESRLPKGIPPTLERQSDYLTHPVFRNHHSETKMLRYLKKLENRDLSLTQSMIPLGSCTMKLNGTTEMMPLSWPEVSDLHPFAPEEQSLGYQRVFKELEASLATLTGFSAVSLQPNSGAQGEFTGLMVIRAYHQHRGDAQRNVVLIPSSAHGTNPASGVMSGMKVVIVKCDDRGDIDIEDLSAKIDKYRDRLSALMVTYPSTHGVFEEHIRTVCDLVHEAGGQVYMDGANLNAQVGLTTPAHIGADVCHLNLHKTFSIPHGGGGPGAGPIAVADHLSDFLPKHPLVQVGGSRGILPVSAAPWGSASILVISHAYIQLMGGKGLTQASKIAILNSNYIKSRLQTHFKLLYSGTHGRVAHEMIVDLRPFKSVHVEAEDVAKRLMDYGFHAPTMSWPVPGTAMIEPTESESKDELDRFCDAMIHIRTEIADIESGKASKQDNVLRNAPHTHQEATNDDWHHVYSRKEAVYPLPYLKDNKFWIPVGRIDNTAGDRHLVCTCLPVEAYEEPFTPVELEAISL
jgi:glycine dehydrogenase